MQTYLDSLVTSGAAGVLLHYRSPAQTGIGSSGLAELGIERRELPDDQVVWGHTGGFYGYLTVSYHSADPTRQLTLSYTGTNANPPETDQVLAGLLG